jgi:K+-transporting ATPase ATPase B chain
VLAKQRFKLRARPMAELKAEFVPFTAQTRMSGVDLEERPLRKGAADTMRKYVLGLGHDYPQA